MDLHKSPHPANFVFAKDALRGSRSGAGAELVRLALGGETARLRITTFGGGVFRLEVEGREFGAFDSVAELSPERASEGTEAGADFRCRLDDRGRFLLERSGGDVVLGGVEEGSFGRNGRAWMWRFASASTDRFFGLGEKWGGLEKTGHRSYFWNTDVWGDYAPSEIGDAEVDAPYASVPYLVVRRGDTYVGLLVDSPYASFVGIRPVFSLTGEDLASGEGNGALVGAPADSGEFHLGALDGAPRLYVLVGPTLLELTKKFSRLVGTTPRPPLWALGHHQSRWGYGSLADLEELDERFRAADVPCDGLWLDIDYLDGYRVFTLSKEGFPGSLERTRRRLRALRRRGRRLVPILDPGVKVEPGYAVYDEGLAGAHFCLAPSGRPYVGVVWPGETHFPDFSEERTRRFWAKKVASLAAVGFDGFWVDMNDPSTGPVENRSMLFRGGTKPHEAFHNTYGHLMARATQEGLLEARPSARPFVLSRSAHTGSARYAAVWTGDNISSFRHLTRSLPVSLNLALSGIPWNGPDVPGFGGNASPRLAERWYQAAALFPFFRNHAVKGSTPQEPWNFPAKTRALLRDAIRFRYRLLPYLYQLFLEHERTGAPILAPLFLYSEDTSGADDVEDQYFVGPDVMVAPVLDESEGRRIRLPRGRWFCASSGRWLVGDRTIERKVKRGELPLFLREGALLPTLRQSVLDELATKNVSAERRLREVDFLHFSGEALTTRTYWLDDGESLPAKTSEFQLRIAGDRVTVRGPSRGAPPTKFRVYRVVEEGPADLRLLLLGRPLGFRRLLEAPARSTRAK